MKRTTRRSAGLLRILIAGGGALACFLCAHATEVPDTKTAADVAAAPKLVEAPDPATPFLVGTGLIGVSLVVRRMRRKRDG